MENKEQKKGSSILHSFAQPKATSFWSPTLILFLAIALALGVGTGFLLTKTGGVGGITGGKEGATKSVKGVIVGSDDLKTYRDEVEGVLREGGIDGEGEYHLERPGGPSQNVYLTSSVVDLSQFVGKKVKAWGDTQKAQKAGWLMDVGRLEVF